MKKYKMLRITSAQQLDSHINYNIKSSLFVNVYCKLLIAESLVTTLLKSSAKISPFYNLIRYYTKPDRTLFRTPTMLNIIEQKKLQTYIYNMIVFSQPKTQLFLMFFKERPVFIFTNGLMKLIINEKKKCSKKMYKVSVSLIKLATVLFHKNMYFNSCSLKFVNVGDLRLKVLKAFKNFSTQKKINYVIVKIRYNSSSQRLNTRRSIKKYVRKRFEIN